MGGRGSSSTYGSALDRTLLKLENGRVGLKYEMVSLVSQKGEVLRTYGGDNTSVDLTKPLKNNRELFEGTVLTHNHPANYNILSADDIKLLGNSPLKELRASDNHYTYSLKKGESKFNNRFYERYRKYWNKAQDKANADIRKDKSIDFMQRAVEYQHQWLLKNAKKHGYVYKRIKR